MRRLLTQGPLLLALLLKGAGMAAACTCQYHSTCDAYQRAEAVFVAAVTAVNLAKVPADPLRALTPPAGIRNLDNYAWQVQLTVEEAFKGITEKTLMVTESRSMCGPHFVRGERWLLYAKRNAQTTEWQVLECSRNNRVAEAGEDLVYLRGLPATAKLPRVSGRVWWQHQLPGVEREARSLAGLKLTARQAGKARHTLTDENGAFVFTGLPFGKYQLEIELPPEMRLAGAASWREFEVLPQSCYSINLPVEPAGSLIGRVLDADDNPVARVYVTALLANRLPAELHYWDGAYAFTDESGRYTITGLPPDSYLLCLGFPSLAGNGQSLPRTFWPNAVEASLATKLVVAARAANTEHDFHLPLRLPPKVIAGVIAFPDDSPIRLASLTVEVTPAATQSPFYINVEHGSFRFKVVLGTKLTIKVSAFREGPKLPYGWFFKTFELEVTDDMKDLKMMIPLPDKPNQ